MAVLGTNLGTFFILLLQEASTTSLLSIFSLDIVNGQKVTICSLGRTALEILLHCWLDW